MILAIIQARYSSSRLPGKVMKKILGRPMLELQFERVKQSKLIDTLIVATSQQSDDEPIDVLCQKNGIACFRGSLNNVLDRFYQAAVGFSPEHVVRLTGDCPLLDSNVIDATIKLHLNEQYDYTSNVTPPTFPDGLDIEVMKFSVLKKAWEHAELPSELEHVTPYINKHPRKFKLGNYPNNKDISYMRWTVDEAEDFEFVTKIYEELYKQNPKFNYSDVLKLQSEIPDLLKLNDQFSRNEGSLKSLIADKNFKEEHK